MQMNISFLKSTEREHVLIAEKKKKRIENKKNDIYNKLNNLPRLQKGCTVQHCASEHRRTQRKVETKQELMGSVENK